jgi:hypothetical protein
VKLKVWRIDVDMEGNMIEHMRVDDGQTEDDVSSEEISADLEEKHQEREFIDFYTDEELERQLDEDAISVGEEAFSRGYLTAFE